MDKRQIIITTLTVTALLILAEQVYQLVHHDVAPIAQAKPASTTPMVVQPAVSTPVYQTQLPTEVIVNQQRLITHQQRYIELVNRYELAKMQRQLLEEEVAIAAARQHIAELTKKTRELSRVSSTASNDDVTASITAAAEPDTTAKQPAYQLAYLDHQGNSFTATLVNHGRYQEVSAGVQLPDGSQVKQIDTDGVLLQTGHRLMRLTFNGFVPVEESLIVAPTVIVDQPIAENMKKPIALVKQPMLSAKSSATIKSKSYMIAANRVLKTSPVAHKHRTSIAGQSMKKQFPAKSAIHKNHRSIKSATTFKKIKSITTVKSSIAPRTEDFYNLGRLQTKNLLNTSHHLSPAQPSIDQPIHLAINEAAPPKRNHIQTYTLDEILLLELPPTSYTIELKGAYDKHDLVAFAKQNTLDENAIYYSVPRHHKIWHVLLYNYFNTQAEAQVALAKLQMLRGHPQIKSVIEIQQQIKARK